MSRSRPTRFIAFLRAVNVGGRTVKMGALREIFADLGLDEVETYLASGNVIFRATDSPAAGLEDLIEERLGSELGYPVPTFVRTADELAQVAAHEPFAADELAAAAAFNIAFTKRPLDEAEAAALQELRTEIDEFRVRGREVYWLCRLRQSQSTFSNAVLERALGRPATLRSRTTVAKMSLRWPPA